MNNRLEKTFAKLKQEKRAGLITYTMAFDPDRATSLEILKALPAAGADIMEVGLPFSDPMADGKIIQAAGIRALKQGATLKSILDLVAEFRAFNSETPIILMGYYNLVYHYGIEKFANDASKVGVDGIIIVDLPPEEEGECVPILAAKGITNVRLIAPTSLNDRLPILLKNASGFVYYISVLGVTGTKSAENTALSEHIKKIKAATPLPVAVGFGIKTPAQAKDVAAYADAVVVGSALVDTIVSGKDKVKSASDFVTELSSAIRTS